MSPPQPKLHTTPQPPRLFTSTAAKSAGELVLSCLCTDDGLLRFEFAIGFIGELKSTLSSHGIGCFMFDSKAMLFNPATGRASTLLSTPNFKFTCSIAFGFSTINDEFKLIHLYKFEKFDNHHYSKVKELVCELGFDPFSPTSTKTWRFLAKCPINVLGQNSYVCVDGNVYWLATKKSLSHLLRCNSEVPLDPAT